MTWLTTYWPAIIAGVSLLSSLINALTPHWSQASPGVKRAMLILLDVLSFIGSNKELKLPGVKSK